MKYPDLWERACKLNDRLVKEVLSNYPIKTNRHRMLVSKAASGGSYNNSLKLMAYLGLQEGLTEEEIIELVIGRIKGYYINITERHQVSTKKQENLDFYIKTQTQLGNYNKEEYRKNE